MENNLRSIIGNTGAGDWSNIVNVNTLAKALGTNVDITTQRFTEFRYFLSLVFSFLLTTYKMELDEVADDMFLNCIKSAWVFAGHTTTFYNTLQKIKVVKRKGVVKSIRRTTQRQDHAEAA